MRNLFPTFCYIGLDCLGLKIKIVLTIRIGEKPRGTAILEDWKEWQIVCGWVQSANSMEWMLNGENGNECISLTHVSPCRVHPYSFLHSLFILSNSPTVTIHFELAYYIVDYLLHDSHILTECQLRTMKNMGCENYHVGEQYILFIVFSLPVLHSPLRETHWFHLWNSVKPIGGKWKTFNFIHKNVVKSNSMHDDDYDAKWTNAQTCEWCVMCDVNSERKNDNKKMNNSWSGGHAVFQLLTLDGK